MSIKPTNVEQFLQDLKGGVYEQQVAHALSEVAEGVSTHGKDGTVTLKFKLKRNAETNQVNITHVLDFTAPHSTGSRSEDTTGVTPMYVNEGGALTLFPIHTSQLILERG